MLIWVALTELNEHFRSSEIKLEVISPSSYFLTFSLQIHTGQYTEMPRFREARVPAGIIKQPGTKVSRFDPLYLEILGSQERLVPAFCCQRSFFLLGVLRQVAPPEWDCVAHTMHSVCNTTPAAAHSRCSVSQHPNGRDTPHLVPSWPQCHQPNTGNTIP